jgi:hypothetical protein
MPEAEMLVMSEEIPLVGIEEAKIEDAIALIAQKVVPLKLLSESEEEEEWIAPVMSLFFDIDEVESEEKDTVGTILAPGMLHCLSWMRLYLWVQGLIQRLQW